MSEPSATNHKPVDSNVERPPENHPGEEVSLFDILIVFAKHKKLILGFPFAIAVLAAIFSFTLTPIFTAATKILPPQQSQSAAAGVLAQLGGLGGIAGGALGLKSPSDLYVGMLRSRRVADGIIQRFNLNTVFNQKLQSGTRSALEGMTKIKSEKDGMITIEVDDTNPKRAADLANAYVDELYKLTSVLAVTEASQRRLFYERQLAQAKENLQKAEIAAKTALQQGGIAQVEGQGRAMIEASARVRAQITLKEVQMSTMRTFATEQNPEFVTVQQELQALKRELGKIEGTEAVNSGVASAGNRGRGMDTVALLRDVKYNETIFELLAKQYEISKMEEAKDSAVIQVLDKAIEPDFRSKPSRRRFVIIAALMALLVALLWVLASEFLARARANPRQAERLRILRRSIWFTGAR